MYKFLITRKIYLSKTISLTSLRYYKSWLQNGQSLRSCPLLMQQKIIFFLHIFFLMKKARTGYELFHTQTFLRIRTIYYFPLLQKENNVCCIKEAIVTGPTPPGTGVINDAFSKAPSSTSPIFPAL